MTVYVCDSGSVVLVRPGRTDVVLLSGAVVSGCPERTEDQARTAAWLGYGEDVERMVEDHDPLHALLCDWLNVGESRALRVAAGEVAEDDPLACLEEDAVLAVQRFMIAAGGQLTMMRLRVSYPCAQEAGVVLGDALEGVGLNFLEGLRD